MATRLYPRTENTALLEALAGVPEGTADRVARVKADFREQKTDINRRFEIAKAANDEETMRKLRSEFAKVDEQEFETVNDDEHMCRYDSFDLDGWGRLKTEAYRLARSLVVDEEDSSAGHTDDPILVEQMLNAQGVILPNGITLHDLEGLYWS